MKPRNANYKLLEIVKRFEPVTTDKIYGTCGNIQNALFGMRATDEFYTKVSSPMLLARLCALFTGLNIEVHGQEAYKVTWQAVIKHKASGHVVTFYDWKGGASFGSDSLDAKNKEFKKDLLELLNVLLDDQCPHPYDGCVVGEIA